jgi:hypothetical protein
MSYKFDIMSNKDSIAEREASSHFASFEERSAWIQLGCLVVFLGGYFFVAGTMLSQGVMVLPAYAAVFGVATAMMVVAMVIAFAVTAAIWGGDERDERDRRIEDRAESGSGWVIGVGVLAAVAAMVLSVPNAWTVQILLGALFLSQVLKLVLQLMHYRRGA